MIGVLWDLSLKSLYSTTPMSRVMPLANSANVYGHAVTQTSTVVASIKEKCYHSIIEALNDNVWAKGAFLCISGTHDILLCVSLYEMLSFRFTLSPSDGNGPGESLCRSTYIGHCTIYILWNKAYCAVLSESRFKLVPEVNCCPGLTLNFPVE